MTSSALPSVGWDSHWEAAFADVAGPGDKAARVVRHDGIALMVQTEDDLIQVRMNLKDAPVVGDWVIIRGGVASQILPRTSLLRRLDPDGTSKQLLAANVDLVMILVALDRPVSSARLLQALQLVLDSGAQPLVILSKSDVHDDAEMVADTLRARHADVEIITMSVKLDEGIDYVLDRAKAGTVVLLGESGAGKSTLTNDLIGEEVAATNEVSERNGLGRHTTTTRELRPLPAGGVLIDSPGVRSFASFNDDVIEGEPATEFGDLDEIAEACHFNNCSHGNEPGCAIRQALEAGEIAVARVRQWKVFTTEVSAKADAVVANARAAKRRGGNKRR